MTIGAKEGGSSSGQEAALAWITQRIVTSDLVRYYFEKKNRAGASNGGDLDAIFMAVQKLMLGSCGFFASVVARRAGQDHLVWLFSAETGCLLHAVAACAPQHGKERLRGDYVDFVGRGSFRDLVPAVEAIAGGPVDVEVGGPIGPEDFLDGEEEALALLAKALPWTRALMGVSRDESEQIDAFDVMERVVALRRDGEVVYTAASIGSGCASP